MERLLAGRYLLEAAVGHGPIGTVWRARDEGTGEVLAVKVLDEPHSGPHTQDRFDRDRYTLTVFLHTAHVRVRDLITDDGVVALVMELVDGVDLHRQTADEGALPTDSAIAVARTLAEALMASHEAGIVHAGVKPTNVLIDTTGQPRLTDSRVAQLAFGGDGGTLPTDPDFLPPETRDGSPPLAAADVYALGQLLLVMLTGSTLAPGLPADDLPAQVPQGLRPIVTACLAADPDSRPTAEQVATTLRNVGIELALGPSEHHPAPGANARKRRPVVRPRPRRVVPPPTPPKPPTQDRTLIGWRLPLLLGVTAVVAAITLYVVLGMHDDPFSRGSNAADRPPRPAASEAAQPTVGPPVSPAAGPPNVDGGTVFLRYWFDVLNHAVTTGDTGPLEAAGIAGCQTCAAAVRTVQDGYRGSSTLRDGTYRIRQITADPFWNINNPKFTVVFDRTGRSLVRADGSVITVLPPVTGLTGEFVLIRVSDRWLMRRAVSSTPVV